MMHQLLDKLQRHGLLTESAASRAATMWREGASPERAILAADGLSPREVLAVIADELNVAYVDQLAPDRQLLARMPAQLLLAHKLLPLDERDGVVRVATATLFQPGWMS